MRYVKVLLTILILSSFPCTSHASVVPFRMLIALQSGGSVAGVVYIDTTQGVFTGADFTVADGGTDYLFNFAPTYQGNGYQTSYYYGDWEVHSSPTQIDYLFQLALLVNSLVAFTGSSICSTSSQCTVPGGYLPTEFVLFDPVTDLAASGSVTPTPEPTTLITFATSGLVILLFVRRKRRQLTQPTAAHLTL